MYESNKSYWIIGKEKITNQLEAHKLASQNTKVESRISFLEDEFDKIIWDKEPSKSWEQLSLERAIEIRQKWKKIKLFFSAGRDSGYLFRVFEQAKIPIDELILPVSPYNPFRLNEYTNHVLPIAKELCRRNPGMVIREVIDDKEWYEKLYKNSDWLTTNDRHVSLMFSSRRWDERIKDDPDYSTGNCGYILGMEKPYVKLLDGVFYSQMISGYVQWAPQNMPGVECFYWSPELYVKQCWMLVNHFEKKYPKCSSDFVEEFQEQTESPHYDELCRALGRGDPMSWACGNGWNKFNTNDHWSMQPLLRTATEEKWKSFNEYRSILNDLHKNYSCLVDEKTKKINLNRMFGKKYLIKKQN